MTLPDLPSLCRYPTVGPSGPAEMDVNGVAASIELYAGRDMLEDEKGVLSPVQWTGYFPALKKYQGEVLARERIHERFARRLDECRKDRKHIEETDWAGLRAILSELFTVFRVSDGERILSIHESYFAEEK